MLAGAATAHLEMGHPHPQPISDGFLGVCPFHGDCFEGLACGPAIAERWGKPAEILPEGHPAWEIEAEVIALALHSYVLTLSPQRIILGGGVMKQAGLFPMIRSRLLESLNGYVRSPALLDHIDSYVVPPGLGDRAGILGSLVLALES
jgi:fructokinase